MMIELIEETHYTLMNLSGKFDSPGSLDFESVLSELNRDRCFLLDFSEIKYLSSAGIRSLLNLEKTQRNRKQKVVYATLNSSVLQVLKLTGLAEQFEIVSFRQEGIDRLSAFCTQQNKSVLFNYSDCEITCSMLSNPPVKLEVLSCNPMGNGELQLLSVEELKFSIGIGGFGNDRLDTAENLGLTVTYPRFAGLKIFDRENEIDCRVTDHPSDCFLFLNQAASCEDKPHLKLDFSASKPIDLSVLLTFITEILEQSNIHCESFSFFLVAEALNRNEMTLFSTSSYGIMIRPGFPSEKLHAYREYFRFIGDPDERNLLSDRSDQNLPNEQNGLTTPNHHTRWNTLADRYLALTTVHERPYSPIETESIQEELNHILDYENIADIKINPDYRFIRGKFYLFIHQGVQRLEPSLSIENLEECTLSDEFELITRKIYSECASIKMIELQGGFSARTFQVFGKDQYGLEILPTILKLSNAAIIKREEMNYENSVKKFILNNTATIMGSFYYLDFGGLRYNFLGITGTGRLKWFGHIYTERNIEDVLPIVDRVYTHILKPWYGQPLYGVVNLYKDHDPVVNFFGEALYEMAKQELGIDLETPVIDVPELGRKIANPYHFLKYGYKERYNRGFKTYKCICHGDLNPQNILFDEKENIYIIDFSETRSRNAVSDFARMETIITTEYFKIETQDDIATLIPFITEMLNGTSIKTIPGFNYHGTDSAVRKGYELIIRMREYARTVSLFETEITPYLIALLEWTLPIVCYRLSDIRKKFSAICCALMVEKILAQEK